MERTPNKPVKSHRIDATPSIPLRPELIACMDPQSLGRYSCASATLRKDVLDSKAWELMANAQKLRSARDAALAAERDAVAWVKSQARRRSRTRCRRRLLLSSSTRLRISRTSRASRKTVS